MKKNNKKHKDAGKKFTPSLPQNILPIGERVLEDKNIYIHQKVYHQIHKFAANKTQNEHGGILVGYVLNEMNKENIIIEGFIEAKYNTATPTTLTFTHKTWDYFHSQIEKNYKGKKIIGWIHTHPNFGIFLSENDKFIQQNFFSDTTQVAYVVDPIQQDEGFFFWIDGKLERCSGFYLFDKNGVKIQNQIKEVVEEKEKKTSSNPILVFMVFLLIIINMLFVINKSDEITMLKETIKKHEQYIYQLDQELYRLNNIINEQTIVEGEIE